MNLLQTIIHYYHNEIKHGFWAAAIGILLLIGGLALWKWASPLSLLKGLSVPMFLFGLLVGLGGGADSLYTNKTAPGKIALYQKDPTTFLKQEKIKTEKTHQGWHGVRVFWTILGVGGLLISILIRKPFWIGAGLGTVALAIIISLFELFSMRFNNRYYRAIQAASMPAVNSNLQETNVSTLLKAQQTAIEPNGSEQKNQGINSNTLSSQIPPRDSLKALSAPLMPASAIKDEAAFNSPQSLHPPILVNEKTTTLPADKKKKVLDYYNSDLIAADGISSRHCWFSKRYIKE